MKFWVVAAAGIIAVFIALTVAVTSSSDSNTPTPTGDVARLTATPFHTAQPGRTPIGAGSDNSTVVPTPTAPASCGFGSGIWEQCAKTAIDPAFADYVTRFSIPVGEQGAVVIEERIDWPDSCLGVDTPGVLCAQVITPGFRFVVTAGQNRPFAEYHTDLSGHSVFVAEYATYATYQDVPPTHTPH
jgi:hypothetical protein